jgi:MFS family permease
VSTAAPTADSRPAAGSRGLWVLMITAFIDMLGNLMVLPLIPFYAKDLGASAFMVGCIISAFSLEQLLSAPMWGRFSDAHGRRPALMIGLGASAISYAIFAIVTHLPHAIFFLFLLRFVQGAGGGTVGVVQAYVADSTAPESRARALGWISAATNAGVALGPVLGSAAALWRLEGPGILAAALCVANIIFAWLFLRESRDMAEASASRAAGGARGRSRDAISRVIQHPRDPASRLIWIYAVCIGAFQGITGMLGLYLAKRFGVTKETIFIFFTYIGVLSVLTRTMLLGPMVDRYGEARLSRLGQVMLMTGLGALAFIYPVSDPATIATWLGGSIPRPIAAFIPYAPLALAITLFPLGTAFTFPCVTSLLSRVVQSNERGLYMGVQQTFGGAMRVALPIVYGALFDLSVPVPFLLAAALVAFTLWLGAGVEEYVTAKPVAAPAA